MALRIELKPHERIIIGKIALTNGPTRTTFVLDGRAPVLRCKDILTPEQADTVCKRLYLLIERVYLEEIPYDDALAPFAELSREIVGAAPSTKRLLEAITGRFIALDLYAALKVCKKLVEYERTLVEHARAA